MFPEVWATQLSASKNFYVRREQGRYTAHKTQARNIGHKGHMGQCHKTHSGMYLDPPPKKKKRGGGRIT